MFLDVQLLGAYGMACLLCLSSVEIVSPTSTAAPHAWTVETAVFYSSFQRSILGATGYSSLPAFRPLDGGDTTPHGVLLEVGWKDPAGDDGAGTPRREISAGILVAPSHDESITDPWGGQPHLTATGNGRFESIWLKSRFPLGPSGSIEVGVDRPYFNEADVATAGDDLYLGSYKRNFMRDVRNVTAGYRMRGRGWEVGTHGLWTSVSTQYGSGRAFLNTKGSAFGGEVDAAFRSGPWRTVAAIAYSSGTLATAGGFFPNFEHQAFDDPLRRTMASISVSRHWDRFFAVAGLQWRSTIAPFWDSQSFIDSEAFQLDQGHRFRTDVREAILGATIGYRFSSDLSLGLKAAHQGGSETVTLKPVSLGSPEIVYDVRRLGWSYSLALTARIQ